MSQKQHRSAQRRAEKRHRREVERRRARTVAHQDGPGAPGVLRRRGPDDLVPSVDEETVVHPYLSHRYREREFLVRGTPWRWRREMPGFWTHAEVAALADDALLGALAERGLVVSRAEVLAHIARMPAGGSAWRMSRIHWLPAVRSRSLSAPDRDFLGLAAVELWRRLRPEAPPLESLLALLADADDLPDHDATGRLGGLLRFLAAARARGGPDSAGEIGGVRLPLGEECVRLGIRALGLADDHPELAAEAIVEVEHWLGQVDLDDNNFLQRLLAMICDKLGRHPEAEERLRVALAQRPDQAATRRVLAVHLHEHAGGERARLVEALELWDSARRLDEADESDEDFVEEEALYQEIREDIVESLRLHDAAVEAAE
ncbi:tetratricopeptide repeat protein [Nannocystis sp. ILAH1]|uniref:tetratricopeptide repeat protein n=1 Tax=Nannocystis sp. ILAH1 TaxID=2996789 RepID=UPI0022721C30|nr:tetratricopeptide repeat protein [Nannocystis sp. ILAH1]MCY0987732.1 tetratricopeptide repeat protein [Nannocystis sp. ILAH1]